MDGIDYTPTNINFFIKKLNPLIINLSNRFYSSYKPILDFDDAKQEILICLYRCLKCYRKSKCHFVVYFKKSCINEIRRYYRDNYHEILRYRKSVDIHDTSVFNLNSKYLDLNSPVICFNPFVRESYREKLSSKNKEIFDLFISSGKANSNLIHRKLGESRYYSSIRYKNFKKEVAQINENSIL